ncbi:class I SAM-dependent methyltransferase [Streptomyces sp. NPDC002490]|uniref:class I SAM-dependent methyltransferase n=1 Tax=Streptomyces sp. NPDC002490 TaxID=3154416 RepID=UPI003334103C
MSTIRWTETDTPRSARWHSENGTPPPRRVLVVDEGLNAATAHRLACEGTALLWRGDFPRARRLLEALGRRVDRKPARWGEDEPAASFHLHRRTRGHRARVLGKLLVPVDADAGGHRLDVPRAPDVRRACAEAYGPPSGPVVVALAELLGVLGAHQWRTKGVHVPALGARIHPHYGVFSPVRGEYVDLVARAPLPVSAGRGTAYDLGTGTGVLAAVLARRGFDRVVATDISPRALDCARDNARRLHLADRVDVLGPGLFPDGRADLVVCNPPWVPARPTSALERGVYDPGGGMLHEFLARLAAHLVPGGEGWLVLSDLAEHLGLRTRADLLARVAAAGLRVVDRIDTRPRHSRARDTADPLHPARAAEVTSLWRLAVDRGGAPGPVHRSGR